MPFVAFFSHPRHLAGSVVITSSIVIDIPPTAGSTKFHYHALVERIGEDLRSATFDRRV